MTVTSARSLNRDHRVTPVVLLVGVSRWWWAHRLGCRWAHMGHRLANRLLQGLGQSALPWQWCGTLTFWHGALTILTNLNLSNLSLYKLS